ncbi:MAG: hypothetical protein RRY13_08710 [Akkermansia sp.]
MIESGHVAYDWNAIPENAPVISFGSEDFLAALPEIRQRTRRTVFVNCMTWLFGKEKEAMSRGDIALCLYQNRQSPRLGGNFHRPENPHIILQLTDTTKNWPRIGFEAMANGSVLIVDKRGGWEQMIIHGKTGWLFNIPYLFPKLRQSYYQ